MDKMWVCWNEQGHNPAPPLVALDVEPTYCYYGGRHGTGSGCVAGGWYIKQSDIDADGEGKARRDHPDTTKVAAKMIGNVGSQRRAVYEAIRTNGEMGHTDQEVSIYLDMSPNSVRPRRVELVEGGHVKDSGQRRKTAAGRDAIVWVTT